MGMNGGTGTSAGVSRDLADYTNPNSDNYSENRLLQALNLREMLEREGYQRLGATGGIVMGEHESGEAWKGIIDSLKTKNMDYRIIPAEMVGERVDPRAHYIYVRSKLPKRPKKY
ncbi:hypothetical protein KW805_01525 [Candidatus Pacearchaeota archaeon]|nr:hypothetical protein [Candidatus Pacearchaeota archaeon]